MIYCPECGWVPVPEDQLPVLLPEVEAYEPTDTGESPLANIPDGSMYLPQCGGPARRETDTMPNWAGSDWYFLRFCDPHNDHAIAAWTSCAIGCRWMFISAEMNTILCICSIHALSTSSCTIWALFPPYPEPYRKRLSHGVILGPDGQRMSKSRGNVIVPEDYMDRSERMPCGLPFIYGTF